MKRMILVAVCLLAGRVALAADPVPNQFVPGTTARAAEVNANFAALVAQLTALEARIQQAVPVGTVLPYAGTTAPPGFLLCQGQVVSRTTYAALLQVIGVRHGGGDGVNSFNIPDYRGRFLRGWNNSSGRDPNASTRTAMATGGATGDSIGTLQDHATALPVNTAFTINSAGEHLHQAPTSTGGAGSYEVPPALSTGYDYIGAAPTTTAGSHNHALTGGDAETRPINVNINYIIKY